MQLRSMLQTLRRPVSFLLAIGIATAPALATWSIVVIDTVTGEVVLASATCLSNINLNQTLGTVVVGKGAGACQSFVFHPGKSIIFTGLNAGKTPAEILADIHMADTDPTIRQYGIVGLEGPAATFTGVNCGGAASGVTGEMGSLRYAIQGNVLTGDAVVVLAESTLLNTEGDLGQRVMAAMQAAHSLGGDGRCSCSFSAPESCGVPPANFTHSAMSSFILIARHGDVDSATCGVTTNNCTNGDYYALLSRTGNLLDPEPIGALSRKYDIWREELLGRADHFKSEVYATSQVLKADGVDTADVDIALVDVNGRPVLTGGQVLFINALVNPGIQITNVTDNGDGTHHFKVKGGTNPGPVRLRLTIKDGIRDVRLWPDLEFSVETPGELFVNQSVVSAHASTQVRFDLNVPANAGGAFHLLGSASGTQPGTPFGGLNLPLNADRLLRYTFLSPNTGLLVNSQGTLDGAGATTAWLNLAPNDFAPFIGSHADFVGFLSGTTNSVTNVVGFDVVP